MAGREPAGGERISRAELRAELEHARALIADLENDHSQSHERLIDSLASHLNEGFSLMSPAGVQLDVNPAFCAMVGLSRDELIGCGIPQPYSPPEEHDANSLAFRRLLEDEDVTSVEATFMRKDGERFPVLITPTVMHNGEGRPAYLFATIKDVSAQRLAERQLRRANRELQAVTNCNQALLRACDEETLLREICRIVCDDAGYRMAWVGYAERDEAKRVLPVASAGHGQGYMETAGIVWADAERGHGPTGTAVRTGTTTWVEDFATDPTAAPWRESARRFGYRSAIALPLKDEAGVTYGALSICSAEAHAFPPEEVRLLEDLAADLAFGVTVLRERARRDQTLQVLSESEARYRSLFEDSPIAMWQDDYSAVKAHLEELSGEVHDVIAQVLADPEEYARCVELGRNVDANRAAVRLFEAESREQLMACNADLYRRESDRGIWRLWQAMLTGEPTVTFEEANLSLRGREIHVLETCTVVPGHEDTYDRVYIADVDISERKHGEEALLQSEMRLQRALSGTVAALGATVATRDPYTANHERRVAWLACRIAERLGWDEGSIETLRTAALVHDVGKITVPAEILSKPTRLTEIEFALVKEHASAAYDILAPIDFGGPVAEIVAQHHERLDGSGYPRGLAADEILPGARVLAVADVVEAMITHRPYRPALSLDEALTEIGPDSRGRFDAGAAEACRELLEGEGLALPE